MAETSAPFEHHRADPPQSGTGACPVDHATLAARSRQKTAREQEPHTPSVARDADGVWHIRGFDAARTLLRSATTRQAGFKAELMGSVPGVHNQPILYQEGKAHQEQRKQTARFFTPKTVSDNYRQLMERFADDLVARLRTSRQADLSDLSLALAVRVAAEVVGLTSSLLPGMARRLDAFFSWEGAATPASVRARLRSLRMQWHVLAFFWLDVQPAIRARRRQPREDVISYLLAQGYGPADILTECITYGAAGMVTTREFISAAAWHLLEHPELRARYLAAPEAERHLLLQEILRLEPVVGHLYRRTTTAVALASGDGAPVTIPAGALVDVHVHGANTDEDVVGADPYMLCPGRPLRDERVPPAVMGFGDGHHRCPGAYVAMQETDIFLRRLLRLDGLRIERPPHVSWNDLVTGYELRDFIVAVE
jgi:cytochrome P450